MTIIAIFAALSETSAAVSLPFLDEEERDLYVWFLISFPFYLLLLFFATLNFNYRSLYAPSDFQKEEHFMRGMENTEPEPGNAQTPTPQANSGLAGFIRRHMPLPSTVRDLHVIDARTTSKKTDCAELMESLRKAQEKTVHVALFITSSESEVLLKTNILKHLKQTRKRYATFCIAYNLNSHRLTVLDQRG